MPFCFKFVFEVPSNIWLNLLLQKEKRTFMELGFWLVNQSQKKTLVLSLKNIQILINYLRVAMSVSQTIPKSNLVDVKFLLFCWVCFLKGGVLLPGAPDLATYNCNPSAVVEYK